MKNRSIDNERVPTCREEIRVAILVLSGFLASCAGGAADRQAKPDRPNVLIVTFDTTRADHLGCFGYPIETSPNLDALAANSVRFDFAISTSGLTPMAHASIFTGLNPHRHGLRVFFGPTGHFLQPDQPTMAEWLRRNGWTTGAFVSAYTASQRYGLDRGFEVFNTGLDKYLEGMDLTRQQRHEHFWHDGQYTNTQRRGDATTDAALEWLDGVQKPFLLWVHYFDPHDPSLVPPADFLEPFGLKPEKSDQARIALYDPEILFMDSQLGRLLDRLRSRGWFGNTIIAVLADHGQGLMQHDWLRHRLLYQEEIRIPLVLRLPGEDEGRVVEDLVRNVDLFPTVLDILGLEPPTDLDGRSLCDLAAGRSETEPRRGFAEALNSLDTHSPKSLPARQQDLLFAVVERDWKLIYHKENPENSELYHLATDPDELRNLIDLHPQERDRLLAVLEAAGPLEIEVNPDPGMEDPEMIEKLRSLGYVQ
jgi:arylsulfatase A-like enzyme